MIPYGIDRIQSRKQLAGRDSAEVYILLQHRWEDEDGNVFAHRVGTGRERYIKSTPDWVNGHSVPIHYGDITDKPFYKSYMGLFPKINRIIAETAKAIWFRWSKWVGEKPTNR